MKRIKDDLLQKCSGFKWSQKIYRTKNPAINLYFLELRHDHWLKTINQKLVNQILNIFN